MRILAVRGQNLASLAEPFAIDLTAEPLSGAGLFAITGETGAGKSTLLDAICLALYGDFPRLDGAAGGNEELPDVSGEAIRARDARTILRRGAAQAWCEVDFVAVDGATYRARWDVYRARGRAGGRLQPAKRQIVRLGADGTPAETIADQVQQVQIRIVELTDFTFDQFRRTVLLAQGEFDAFIRAKDAERGELLEKITGTEIYARLSARAFERARAAREAVALLEARRHDIGGLDPAVRAEKIGHRAALAERLAEVRGRADATRAGLELLARIAEAENRLALAEVERSDAESARAAAGDLAERLDRYRRAHALRPVFDQAREAEARLADAASALAAVEARLAETTPAIERAIEGRDAAKTAMAAVEARIAGFAPQWEAAAQLDGRIEAARRERDACATPCAAAAAARDGERRRLAELDARRADLAAGLARTRHDLARLVAFARLTERWDDVEPRLAERSAATRDGLAAAARRRSAEAAIEAAAGRLAESDARETTRREDRSEREARIAERRAVLAAIDEAALRTRDGALAARQSEVARLQPIAAYRAAALADAADATDETVRAEADAAAARAGRADLVVELDRVRAHRDGLAVGAELAEALASREAARLRGALVEGEPCPVCGATDHPILADPHIAERFAGLRAARVQADATIRDLERRIAATDGAIAGAETRLGEAARRLAAATARRERAEAELTPALARLALARASEAPVAADPVMALEAEAERIVEARRGLAVGLDRAEALRREIEDLRRALERLDAEREADRLARGRDEEARAAARVEAAAAAEAEAGAARRCAELDPRLEPLLADLEIGLDDLERDGDRLIARIGRGVAERRGLIAAEATASAEIATLERDRVALVEAFNRADVALTDAEANLRARTEETERLTAERAGLLDGRSTADHRAAAAAERAGAAERLEKAETGLRDARSDHDSTLGLYGERHHALIEAQDDWHDRLARRDRALAAADLDPATAVGLFAVGSEEVAVLGADIAARDERVTRADAALAERRRDLEAALAVGRPETPKDELEAALAEARAAAEALNREIGGLDQVLAADDAARAAAVELEAEIAEAAARRDVFAAIDEAIGSRDGAKFRQFAQGITLDRLTGLANRHLASLNPRYRLARAEGLGLAIVDRDMGEESRSTRSLSGGERFLASLALALALSGLEGRRSFVDTLFVDEGFGALDAATLDVAIDALEGLQSEGRKVGVISHVTAMHDRIPVQIRVEKAGAGRSRVRVVDGVE